ncbi:unnamed protein product [Schistosoma turkestanicum]|nr:unnamed protein product [Schistosoma turkestanicum]
MIFVIFNENQISVEYNLLFKHFVLGQLIQQTEQHNKTLFEYSDLTKFELWRSCLLKNEELRKEIENQYPYERCHKLENKLPMSIKMLNAHLVDKFKTIARINYYHITYLIIKDVSEGIDPVKSKRIDDTHGEYFNNRCSSCQHSDTIRLLLSK